jgi:hypothetical protein
MDAFLKYYALDWAAMTLSLLAVHLLGKKNKLGFLSFAMANMIWMSLGFTMIHSLGIGIGNFAFLIMNLKGFITWNHHAATI